MFTLKPVALVCFFVALVSSSTIRAHLEEDDTAKPIDLGTDWARLTILSKQNAVATGYKKGVRIYDLETRELIRTLDDSYVNDLKPFKDNQLIQASDDGLVKIWNVETGELLRTLNANNGPFVNTIALNKDQTLMLTGGFYRSVSLWDMTQFKLIRTFNSPLDPDWPLNVKIRVTSVIFNEAKDQVIAASSEGKVRIWNINDGSLIHDVVGHTRWAYKLLLDEHTGRMFSASGDPSIYEWDLETATVLRVLDGHTLRVDDIVLSQDGKQLISSSWDKSVVVWDKETGSIVNRFSYTHPIMRMALTPSNDRLLTTTQDEKLLFLSLKQ